MPRRSTHLPKDGERWCPRCQKYLPISEFAGIDIYCHEHRKEARERSREKFRERGKFGNDASLMDDTEFIEFCAWFMEKKGEKDAAKRLRGSDYAAPPIKR